MSKSGSPHEAGPSHIASRNNTWRLRRAVGVLRAGGVISYPTEAVFGLGCNPRNAEAVLRLLALKERDISQGLILVASRFSQLQPFIGILPSTRMREIQSSWPGPVTWIFPAHSTTPSWLTGCHDSLAVRVSANPRVVALCEHFGNALVSTSANISGRSPARSILAVRRQFGRKLDYILPGRVGGRERPSEIRDGWTGRVLRP
ncbi:MAG: L-threonylcarbamoyladenylate synthase [Candidatus Kentron sp. G]|nr:MAG: L-threonylcarbamoyladenylate synthase [Candidatus Kentron sp. G]VFM96552.1 MAG: L-threonylcarbamoyladenylate synthase [Candidatus Kentron sp. G]VFN00482.1 MAG: L-threonylcarbamoyladenylate synthase [Candidatus Kentron sp. G]